MCGIAGVWNRNGSAVEAAAIRTMNAAEGHRGPDAEGVHVAGDIGLGHQRLSIVALCRDGTQPVWLPDRSLALVYSGEIHNCLELAAQLRAAGVALRTCSDTEGVLRAHERWGMECFERFSGIWAMAFWHPREARLLLCCGCQSFCDECGLLRQRVDA